MPPVNITSEIGPLEVVLVHTPGLELEAVTPGNREDYLYDDLIGLEVSAREHALLKAVLERFATVHEIADLLTAFGLPSRASFEPSVVRDRMQSDKKSTAGHQTWVLPNGSKEVDLVTGIGDETIDSALDFVRSLD